ncbi:MAG: hypothetical protein RLZZ241_1378, partial [Bacteroidota bacterium]
PGSKLLFMGGEFGQSGEWNFQQSLDWHLLQYGYHSGLKQLVQDLNTLYRDQPSLYEKQFSPEGFKWIDYSDAAQSVISFMRLGHKEEDAILIVCNFTPVPRSSYRIGVPKAGDLIELFNSDLPKYCGSGIVNDKKIKAEPIAAHKQHHSIAVNLPPLGAVWFKYKE